MAEKIYEPEVVQDTPFPNQTDQPTVVNQTISGGVVGAATTKEKVFPKKRVAVELLSQVLNTRSRKVLQEFDLEQSGGFRVGNYQEGISGDISITPNGIVGRDLSGIQTFVLDNEGNLAMKGEIRSGSLITGQVVVGNNRVIIDIDENGEPQIIVNDGTYDRVLIGYGDF